MKLEKDQFINKLKQSAEEHDICLSEDALMKLYEYKELLIFWNEKINLTAITDDEEIIEKHIIDSLEATKYIKEGTRIIDVGTGAGLPGIIISIYFDEKVEVTLFDALNKRIIFLQEVISKLNLKNTVAIHGRAEEIAKTQQYREKYDIVISRAVANLNTLLELTVPFVKTGGLCIYMKADKTSEELNNAKTAIKKLYLSNRQIKEYQLSMHSLVFRHTLILFNKEKNTERIYPRQFAKIKNNPL